MTGIMAKAKKMVIIILRNSKALDIIFSIFCVITDRKMIKPTRKTMDGFKMGPNCGNAKPAKTITKNKEIKIVFGLSFMILIAILLLFFRLQQLMIKGILPPYFLLKRTPDIQRNFLLLFPRNRDLIFLLTFFHCLCYVAFLNKCLHHTFHRLFLHSQLL